MTTFMSYDAVLFWSVVILIVFGAVVALSKR